MIKLFSRLIIGISIVILSQFISLRLFENKLIASVNKSVSTPVIQSGLSDSIIKVILDYHDYGIIIAGILLIFLLYINYKKIKAKRHFKQYELNFKAFFKVTQDLIFKFSREGVIEEFYSNNPEKLFKPLDEILKKNIFDILPDSIVGKIYNAIQECLSQDKIVTIEYTFEYKDNPPKLEEARFVKIDNDHVIVVVRDITDRKTTLSQLQKLHYAFEQTMDGVAVANMDGYIEFVNKAWADNHGYTPEELIGKHLSIFHTQEQYINDVIPFNEEVKSKGEKIGEVGHVRKDGTIFPAIMTSCIIKDNQGEALGLIGIARDITERKQAELKIRKSEERFKDLADLLPQTLFEIDTKGNITYTNKVGLETFGYDSKDLEKGINVFDLFILEDRERLLKNMKQSMAGAVYESHEYTAMTKNGDLFNVLVYSSPIISDGKVIGLRGVLFDITEIKKTQKALRDSEERYKELADLLPQPVFEVDVEGNVLFLNQAGRECFGYTHEDLEKGLNVLQGFIPEDRERVIRNIKKDIAGEPIQDREYTALRQDGSTFQVYAYSNPIIRDDKPVGLRGVLIDLTPLKKAEKAIAESEEKYRQLIENVYATICILDYEGRFHFMNSLGAKVHFLEKDDFVNKTIWDLFPKNIADNKMKIVRRVIDSGKGEQSEVESIINGKPYWFYTITQPYDYFPYEKRVALIIAHDITERKRAEDALRSSEEKFRNFAEHSLQGIYIVQDDKIVFVNEKAIEITGISRDKFNNMDVKEFGKYVIPHQQDSAYNRYRARIEGDKSEDYYECEFITPDGETKWLEFFGQKTIINGKDVLYGIVLDITLRKKAEAAIRKAQQERYNTIREIAGGVSHEMYNALYPAIVALDKLKNNITNNQLTDEQKKHLFEMAGKAVNRAISMTEKVTHYSRIESEKKIEAFDINNLIKEIIENNKTKINELQIDITLSLDCQVKCLCHKNHAFSIFNNLIINAIDALAEVDDRKLIIKSAEERGYVKISVFDSGIGIPEKHIDKIFDPFFSTKPHTGTGLGLAMVKKIVDIHNGEIKVNSSLDKGTEFVIFLKTADLAKS